MGNGIPPKLPAPEEKWEESQKVLDKLEAAMLEQRKKELNEEMLSGAIQVRSSAACAAAAAAAAIFDYVLRPDAHHSLFATPKTETSSRIVRVSTEATPR